MVKSAEEAFQRNGKSFERVFAVFDRDGYEEYANAIHMAGAKNGKLKNDEKHSVIFDAIVSVPCFELWLLLHFQTSNIRYIETQLSTSYGTTSPITQKACPTYPIEPNPFFRQPQRA